MTTTRKRNSAKFKGRVAVEGIRDEKTLSQSGAQLQVDPVEFPQRREAARKQLQESFADGRGLDLNSPWPCGILLAGTPLRSAFFLLGLLWISVANRCETLARCCSTTVSSFTNSREFVHCEQNRMTAILKHRSHLVIGSGVLSFQDGDLLSEGEVFQQQTLSTVQEAIDSSEEE